MFILKKSWLLGEMPGVSRSTTVQREHGRLVLMSCKVNHTLAIWPSDPTPVKTIICPHKRCKFHGSFILTNPKLKQPKCLSTGEWINKSGICYSAGLLRNNKDPTTNTHKSVDKSRKHDANEKITDTKEHVWFNWYENWERQNESVVMKVDCGAKTHPKGARENW